MLAVFNFIDFIKQFCDILRNNQHGKSKIKSRKSKEEEINKTNRFLIRKGNTPNTENKTNEENK